jgi:hypothetical protein
MLRQAKQRRLPFHSLHLRPSAQPHRANAQSLSTENPVLCRNRTINPLAIASQAVHSFHQPSLLRFPHLCRRVGLFSIQLS